MSPTGFEGLKALACRRQYGHAFPAARCSNSIGITEIAEATNGQAAAMRCCTHSPDLVLTDLAMAPMDAGWNSPAMSATTRTGPRSSRAHHHGQRPYRKHRSGTSAAVTVLAKPVNAHTIFARIAEIAARPRAFNRCATPISGPIAAAASSQKLLPARRAEDFQQVDIH